MADALGSDRSLLASEVSGYTYNNQSAKKRKGLFLALFVITVLIAGVIVIIYVTADDVASDIPTPAPTESYLLHSSHIPFKFVHRISRYRSAVQSWPGLSSPFNHNNTCGCLKHWFEPFSDIEDFNEVTIYSPLQGTIIEVTYSDGSTNASQGWDIRIKGSPEDGYGLFIVQIEHVNITDHEQITAGKVIQMGHPIGHHIGSFVNSAISVLNQSAPGGQFISMFNVIDDKTLQEFRSWNVSNRTFPVITDSQRQLYPLNCTGDEMNAAIANNTNYAKLQNWIELNTTSPTVLKRKEEETVDNDFE